MRLEHWFYTVPLRLRTLLRRGRVERELDEELHYHLERQIEENITKGMSAEEARYAALRAMGGGEQRKEECRDMRRVNLVEDSCEIYSMPCACCAGVLVSHLSQRSRDGEQEQRPAPMPAEFLDLRQSNLTNLATDGTPLRLMMNNIYHPRGAVACGCQPFGAVTLNVFSREKLNNN